VSERRRHRSHATSDEQVRAAGGVVAREVEGGTEVLVVHRPRYDDWSFPKGKLDPGETFEEAAVREVAEESAVHVELGDELIAVEYVDHCGRPKVVRYWTMTEVAAGVFAPNHEVDEVRWVELDAARELLSYDTDLAVLDAYLEQRRQA
jgi:8-oxo-dGTP diphosphatase